MPTHLKDTVIDMIKKLLALLLIRPASFADWGDGLFSFELQQSA